MRKSLNGIPVSYQLQGPSGAPAVVLIHGFPFSSALWKGQVKALAREYRVLTYDLRGMGKSGLGRLPQLLEAYVDDLFALMDSTGLGRAALVGLSMGGYIALRAAEREAWRVWALGLCDTKAEADGDEARLGRAAGIRAIREKGTRAFAQGMLPKLLAPATLKRRPAVVKALLKMMLATKADGMANALAAMAGRSSTAASLSKFKGPVLALAGQFDAITPPALARAMAATAKQGRSVVIGNAGHVSNLEAPVAFNRELLRFLRRAQGLELGRIG